MSEIHDAGGPRKGEASEKPPKMSKAERLAVASAVAGQVRQQAQRPRKIVLVDKEGKPKGETTNVEVAKSLLKRSEIEFSVQNGNKALLSKCTGCGVPFVREKKKTGGVRRHCDKCRQAFRECRECKAPVARAAGLHAKRNGHLPRCRKCTPPSPALVESAKKRSRKSAERAAQEAVCRQCGVPLSAPKTTSTAWTLRRMYPEGRRCRSCGNKANRAAQKARAADSSSEVSS